MIFAALTQPRLSVMSALSKPTLRLFDTHSLRVAAGWVGRAVTPFLRLQSDYGLTIRDLSLNIHPPQFSVGETLKFRHLWHAARPQGEGRRSLPEWLYSWRVAAMSTNLRQDDGCNAAVTQSTRILLDLHNALERLERLEEANGHLRELVQHCSAYWGYSHCGYQHMEPLQRALYDEVIGRTARSQTALSSAAARACVDWRSCEFCGCNTNARERVCCQPGRDADRRSWSQPA
jgi:hypothetical protein